MDHRLRLRRPGGVHSRTHPAAETDSDALVATDVRVWFGGVKAVDGVDVSLARNEILGLIGPNGAGKTTLVNALSGFQRLTTGSIVLNGEPVTGLAPHVLVRKGLVRTFQSIRPFRLLSILDNLQAYAVASGKPSREARLIAWELLDRLGLADRAHSAASGLPHGLERRLGIARALAASPRFLLLDEPAAGLNETETDELVSVLSDLRHDYTCGMMVIEHDMHFIMRLCDRIQVLDFGRTISKGTPEEVRVDEAVIEAYLGV